MGQTTHKFLTYILLLAIVMVPVQVVNAVVSQLDMEQSMMSQEKCSHHNQQSKDETVTLKNCCDDSSHQCNHCSSVSSVVMLPATPAMKHQLAQKEIYQNTLLLLSGSSSSGILRPPQLNG